MIVARDAGIDRLKSGLPAHGIATVVEKLGKKYGGMTGSQRNSAGGERLASPAVYSLPGDN